MDTSAQKKYASSLDYSDFDFDQRLSPMMPKELKSRGRRPGFYFLLNADQYKVFDVSSLSREEFDAHLLIKSY